MGDKWNWLDAFIVFISLIDFAIELLSDGDSGSTFSVFRLIRVLRVIRVISFLEKMVYLVSAFVKGMESVLWVLVLWAIAIYICAVMAKGFFGDNDYLKEQLKGKVNIEEHFGSIPRSIVTLIAFYTYDSANILQRQIGEQYPAAWAFFLFFMVIVSIGIMELMTSLFIDSLLEEKKRMERKLNKAKLQRRNEVNSLIKGLFDAFDEDNSATLDKEELDSCLAVFDDPETKAMLDYVEVDPAMMRAAIKVADIDGDGEVTSEEFTSALESIHEPPMKSDLREVHQRVGQLQMEFRKHIATNETQFQDLNSRLARLEVLLTTGVSSGTTPANAPPLPTGAPPLPTTLTVSALPALPVVSLPPVLPSAENAPGSDSGQQ